MAQSPGAAAPKVSATPQASPRPVSSPVPAPAPSKAPESVVAPQASATPGSSVTPAAQATSSPGTLDYPTQAEQDAAAQWKRKGVVGHSTFMDKVRTVTWALGLVCLLIWLIGKVVGKSTLEKLGLPVEPDSLIEVLEKKRISPGRSIMLVRVGPKVLALGVTENGFRTLTEIDAEAVKQHEDSLKAAAPSESVAPPMGVTTPGDVAKHYLSIIPGLGAKK